MDNDTILPPKYEVWGQSNVFTGVCHSVHGGGGVCLPTMPRGRQTPWPGGRQPQARRQSPLARRQNPSEGRPPSESRRAVRILLECILILKRLSWKYVHITLSWELLLMDGFRCRPSYSLWHPASRLQSRDLCCVFGSQKHMLGAQLSVNNLNKYEQFVLIFLSATEKMYGSMVACIQWSRCNIQRWLWGYLGSSSYMSRK